MATPNVQVVLQEILTATNNLLSPPPYLANVDLQNPTLNGTVFFQDGFFQATTGGVAVTLPASKIFALVVQNLDPANNLTVTVTPFGGVPSAIQLGPNGVYTYFDTSKLGTGISALTLTGITATVPALVIAAA